MRRSLPAAARTVKITTAILGHRSSSIGAAVEALSIAIHQTADRKEVVHTPTCLKFQAITILGKLYYNSQSKEARSLLK